MLVISEDVTLSPVCAVPEVVLASSACAVPEVVLASSACVVPDVVLPSSACVVLEVVVEPAAVSSSVTSEVLEPSETILSSADELPPSAPASSVVFVPIVEAEVPDVVVCVFSIVLSAAA